MKKLTTFDVLRILGYVIAAGTSITPNVLHSFGFTNAMASEITTEVGRVVLFATLISNVIKNPSPPSGTVSANIPVGTAIAPPALVPAQPEKATP